MAHNAILMSIRPKYANKIFDGTKTVELRRIKPKTLDSGDLILVYVSSPIKSLVGAFRVARVVEKPLPSLWKAVKDHAGVSYKEFLRYYEGVQLGVAIFIKDVWILPKPIHLSDLQKEESGFYPPQNFQYTSIKQTNRFQSFK
jgi:predicted transcriptional regulator